MPLKGRKALITGSTSGIGQAIATKLASQGADIMLNGFGDTEAIETQRAALESEYDVRAFYNGADVGSSDAMRDLVDNAADKLGGLNIMVNNVGLQYVGKIEDYPEDKWDDIIRLSLSTVFWGTKYAIPHLKARRSGRIINISSALGKLGAEYKCAYTAAKHGVLGFTKVSAIELSEYSITCNAICPGFTDTPHVEKQVENMLKLYDIPEEDVVEEVMLKEHTRKKFVKLKDIAALAAFLCSNEAASITGAAYSIDRGWATH